MRWQKECDADVSRLIPDCFVYFTPDLLIPDFISSEVPFHKVRLHVNFVERITLESAGAIYEMQNGLALRPTLLQQS